MLLVIVIPHGFLTFVHLFIHLFSICCFLLCVRPHVKYWGAELNKIQASRQEACNLSGRDYQGHETTQGMVLGTSKKLPLLISLPSYSEIVQNPFVQPHKHSSPGTSSNTFC